ncbi:MAG TPA: Wzz/FepE/Etk N-terminal domain-containing protein, partial [Anaerolineae bacterium]|nr:Wzz/FepE/Etk N-terminal domain-containing protein [Anaerolineae bacterium]
MEEDYLDLRVYLDVLLRRRRGIALFTALLMLVGWLYSLLTPPTYQAATGLVVAPKRADLHLTAVLSLSAEDAQRVDLRYRNAALVEVAGSAEIAQRVLAADPALMDQLDVRSPSALARKVKVEGKDDWISIQASAPTAELAARLAAAWAHEAEIHINALYAPDSTVADNLEQESQTALGDYQQAQAELEAFLGQSRRAPFGFALD